MNITLTRSEKISLFLKRASGMVYWSIPGPILTVKGKREHYTVYRSLWVKIHDGSNGEDWMPISFCAPEFIAKVEAKLNDHWFLKHIKLTQRQDAFMKAKNAQVQAA